MDRRHRSASRSRREERRSTTSVRGSHESSAGNISPGRHYHSHHARSRREHAGSGGGFFASLFGRREKSPPPHIHQQQQQQMHMQMQEHPGAPQPPQTNASPGSKLRALLSFAPHHPGATRQAPAMSPPSVPVPSRIAEEPLSQGGKGLQHTIEVMQDSYKNIESRLHAEQRLAQEWKDKWNYNNFKLNLMVDMLVLRVLELEQKSGAAAR